MNHAIFAAAAALSLLAAPASAITSYVTTVDYFPSGTNGTSMDPADGNLIVIEWSTAATSGTVEATDLVDLTFTLFGSFTNELFRDEAIIDGVAQPVGGRSRSACGLTACEIVFEFDLDAFAIEPFDGLGAFDSGDGVDSTLFDDGTFYLLAKSGVDFVGAFGFVDGALAPGLSTRSPEFGVLTELAPPVQPIPLPAPALMLLSALGAAAFAARRRTG